MQFRLSILTILLAVFVFVPSVSADPPTEPKEKSVDTQAETKPHLLRMTKAVAFSRTPIPASAFW